MKKVIISRSDAIGDVILTLPVAGILKKMTEDKIRILFLGRSYTEPVIDACKYVDQFLNYDEFQQLDNQDRADFLSKTGADTIIHVFPDKGIAHAAFKAGIPLRAGTAHRAYHWLYCNERIRFSRRKSNLHEALLNIKLLPALNINPEITIEDIPRFYGLNPDVTQLNGLRDLISPRKFNLIIHPKSKKHAREWSLDHFKLLIDSLPENRFRIIITGSEDEAQKMSEWIKSLQGDIVDLTGKTSLKQMIALISQCDGLVAASTGPLHIAAALGIHALGLYPPIRPMHPGRWAPIGIKSEYIVVDKDCSDCRKIPDRCNCINLISSLQVRDRIMNWIEDQTSLSS
jgi:heptosyltransferase III